ncbi:MAG TPA: putative hydro-lyase [Chloroflexia bacterium]|nr:putative hydro-lyase [Chloroflexia bacterium]
MRHRVRDAQDSGYPSPAALRAAIRAGEFSGPTAGQAPGFAQANLVILPAAEAAAFRAFCDRNPRPCPVLEVTAPGDPVPHHLAPAADLRTDLPRYRVYRDGVLVAERTAIRDLWRADLVAFLIGCSFTFESALLAAGIPVRHIELGCNVPMYRTNRPCTPAGRFAGPLVVSMRPLPAGLVAQATAITGRYPRMHGAPIHAGDPAALGIADLAHPDYGDAVPLYAGEQPVFWACGVTPQAVAVAARVPLMITHAPGHMFVGDRTDAEILDARREA